MKHRLAWTVAIVLSLPLAAQSVDLQILSMNVAKRDVEVGGRFTVTMEWTNAGPETARDIMVTLTSNGGLVLTGAGTSHWPCEPMLGASGFQCRGAQIAPGAVAHMVVNMLAAAAPAPATMLLEGRILSSATDRVPANDVRALSIPLSATQESSALTIEPLNPELSVDAGTETTIPLVVRNDGPSTARELTLFFAFAPGLEIPVTGTGGGWTCGNATHSPWNGVCKRDSLAPGSVSTIHVHTVAPAADGAYPFAARVAAERQTNPSSHRALTTTTLRVGDDPPPPPPQRYSRVLVPLTGGDVPGANGSLWRTETTALVAEPEPEILPLPAPDRLPLGVPFDARSRGLVGGSANGQFLYVREGEERALSLHSRVYDVARTTETAGSEIPIVPELAFTSEPIVLVDVPVAPQYRHTVRVYDYDGQHGARVAVRLFVDDETAPRATSIVTLALPPDASVIRDMPTRPAYAQLDPLALLEAHGMRSLRVEIAPLDPGARIWAFLSLTNNDTHHVTTLSAR